MHGTLKTMEKVEGATMPDKLSLRQIRASLGLTQKQLAEGASLSVTALIEIEKGRVTPRLLTAYALVNALNDELRKKGKAEVSVSDFWQIE